MSWAVGYDDTWKRDIGYGVPAYCDHPGCAAEIHRGLAYVCCDQETYGGERGCGLYFCGAHGPRCDRCEAGESPYKIAPWPQAERPDWLNHILTCPSWWEWRRSNHDKVQLARAWVRAIEREGRQ